MTDRIHTLTVALADDPREDDVQSLIDAIKHFRGVVGVTAHPVDFSTYTAEMRANAVWREKLFGLLDPKQGRTP